jgi:hypothetical protein
LYGFELHGDRIRHFSRGSSGGGETAQDECRLERFMAVW